MAILFVFILFMHIDSIDVNAMQYMCRNEMQSQTPIYAICVEKFILLLFDALTLQNIYENNFYSDAAAGFYVQKRKKNAAAWHLCATINNVH